jgi:hypothetical protein
VTSMIAEEYLATLVEHAWRPPVGDPSTEDVAAGVSRTACAQAWCTSATRP